MKKYFAAGAVVLAAFAVMRAQEPTTPADLVKAAEAAVRRADYAAADALYAKAAAQPDSPALAPALLYLGVRALGSNNPLAAQGFFERLLRVDPKGPKAGAAMSWLATMRAPTDPAGAEELYQRALDLEDPGSLDYTDTLHKYSALLQKQGRVEEGRALDRRAIVTRSGKARTAEPMPNGVYRVGAGVTAPTLVAKREPEYTEQARVGKIQGTVLLQVDISPDGTAGNFQVLRSLEPGLDQKAIEAVQQWRFNPGMKDGQPVTVRATIEVNFRLI